MQRSWVTKFSAQYLINMFSRCKRLLLYYGNYSLLQGKYIILQIILQAGPCDTKYAPHYALLLILMPHDGDIVQLRNTARRGNCYKSTEYRLFNGTPSRTGECTWTDSGILLALPL